MPDTTLKLIIHPDNLKLALEQALDYGKDFVGDVLSNMDDRDLPPNFYGNIMRALSNTPNPCLGALTDCWITATDTRTELGTLKEKHQAAQDAADALEDAITHFQPAPTPWD